METGAIKTFADIAREYCKWCEERHVGRSQQLLVEGARLLARLYAAALDLPDIAVSDDDPDAPDIPSESRRNITSSFADLPFQMYWEVFDPIVEEEPVCGDVTDDLTDIYLDVKSGLALFDQGSEAAAVWHWRLLFRSHWGHHATSALRAVHCWMVSH
jgi:Domain of unknown function (DUF5063)